MNATLPFSTYANQRIELPKNGDIALWKRVRHVVVSTDTHDASGRIVLVCIAPNGEPSTPFLDEVTIIRR